jgi:hypothetical protein
MEDRSQAILVEMRRLIEESRLLRRKHDQLTEEYEELKSELDSLIREKIAGRDTG